MWVKNDGMLLLCVQVFLLSIWREIKQLVNGVTTVLNIWLTGQLLKCSELSLLLIVTRGGILNNLKFLCFQFWHVVVFLTFSTLSTLIYNGVFNSTLICPLCNGGKFLYFWLRYVAWIFNEVLICDCEMWQLGMSLQSAVTL